MAIEIKENKFIVSSDLNYKGVYHICNKKHPYFEIIRFQVPSFSVLFSWGIMTNICLKDNLGRIPVSDINNCPFCGTNLEKEYQTAINPPEKTEQSGKSVDPIFYYGC